MHLARSFPGGNGLRLTAALALFLSLLPGLHAQQIPVPVELKGQGEEIKVWADSQQKDKDTYHLRGHVRILYQQMRLTADEASFDDTSNELMARGHVVFDDPTSHLVAEEVHYNIQTQKGWFSSGIGNMHSKAPPRPRVLKTENPFYIQGQTVDRLDEDTFLVSHGSMTTCECAKKGWSFSMGKARVTPGKKVVAHNAVFRFLGVPIFYLPFMVASLARDPRQSGFLLPHLGNSSQKGYIIGEGFFWDINPSLDLMLGVEDYSKRGLAQRVEFRAKPTPNAEFAVNYFGVNDRYSGVTEQLDPTTNTYKKVPLAAPGESIRAFGKDDDVGDGFRAVVNFEYVNTMAFRITWSPNYAEAVSSEAVQAGFLTKNWDAYSFNVSAERYEDFLSTQLVPANAVIIRHLPSVQLAGEDRQIGNSPVYFSFESSVDLVGRTAPGLALPLLNDRLDFHPQLLLRSKEFWHFRFIPSAGFRVTHYGDSIDPNQALVNNAETNHGSVNRVLGEVGLDLRPPSLEKVFTNSYRGYRLKHVIEPDIQYHLVRENNPESILDIVRFDATDIFTETNDVEYSLTNTILARKDVPDNSPDTPQARDIFSWRLSQKYYFDPRFGGALDPRQNNVFAATIDVTGFSFEHGQRFSPIDSVFKFAPFSNYDTEIRTDINPSGKGGILDAGITSHVKRGLLGVSFSDFFINKSSYFSSLLGGATGSLSSTVSPLTAFHLLGSVVTYGDPNRRGFSGALGMDYNFQQKIFQHAVTQVSYNFGCFAIDVEYQDYNLTALRHESQFRVALALANVGTFGNLKPRERLY